LINLILGENVLPHAQLPVTSTICEVRQGSVRKFKIYYNDERESEEISMSDPAAKGKSYIDQLTPFLRQEENRDMGSPIKKIELYWPHEMLKVSSSG
jgi:hypothetical protein